MPRAHSSPHEIQCWRLENTDTMKDFKGQVQKLHLHNVMVELPHAVKKNRLKHNVSKGINGQDDSHSL